MRTSSHHSPLVAALSVFAFVAVTPALQAQTGGVFRVTTSSENRINLSLDQMRALVGVHHPAIANGGSEDNMITLVLGTNGAYVASGSSKGTFVARGRSSSPEGAGVIASAGPVGAVGAVAVGGGSGGGGSAARATTGGGGGAGASAGAGARSGGGGGAMAAVSSPTESIPMGSSPAGTLRFAGVDPIDATQVRDMYVLTYKAGDLGPNEVLVRVITLVGNSIK